MKYLGIALVLMLATTAQAALAPIIITQPFPIANRPEGSVFELSIWAVGTAPLSYQWQKNGTNISGATTTQLSLPSVNQGYEGNYRCVVTNAVGTAVSQNSRLYVGRLFAVTVVDSAPPIVEKPYGANITLPLGSQFDDAYISVIDVLPVTIEVTGDNVDTSVPGVYTRRYVAKDLALNTAPAVTITFTVEGGSGDTTKPIILLRSP